MLFVPNTDLPNAKLILLYILWKVPGIPSSELMDQAIQSLYMDYFLFIQAKEDLKRDHLMLEAVRKGETRLDAARRPIELCDLSPEGETVLTRLLPTMSSGVLAYLTAATADKLRETRREASVLAGYAPDANGTYLVRLVLSDGARTTADLSLFAPDEKTAANMCRRWKESTAGVYTSLIKDLFTESE